MRDLSAVLQWSACRTQPHREARGRSCWTPDQDPTLLSRLATDSAQRGERGLRGWKGPGRTGNPNRETRADRLQEWLTRDAPFARCDLLNTKPGSPCLAVPPPPPSVNDAGREIWQYQTEGPGTRVARCNVDGRGSLFQRPAGLFMPRFRSCTAMHHRRGRGSAVASPDPESAATEARQGPNVTSIGAEATGALPRSCQTAARRPHEPESAPFICHSPVASSVSVRLEPCCAASARIWDDGGGYSLRSTARGLRLQEPVAVDPWNEPWWDDGEATSTSLARLLRKRNPSRCRPFG